MNLFNVIQVIIEIKKEIKIADCLFISISPAKIFEQMKKTNI